MNEILPGGKSQLNKPMLRQAFRRADPSEQVVTSHKKNTGAHLRKAGHCKNSWASAGAEQDVVYSSSGRTGHFFFFGWAKETSSLILVGNPKATA